MLENILKMLEIARKCLELQENVMKCDIILESLRNYKKRLPNARKY